MKENNLTDDFLVVLEKNIASIFKIAHVYAHTSNDKEDMVNDIIYELWKSYPRFRGDAKISTWLYRVALNVALRTKRGKERNKLVFVSELKTLEGKDFFEPASDNSSEIKRMYECIERLDPVNRAIVLLYLDEKTNDEIAAVTGLSKTNISTRLSRIRQQLRELMKEQ